MKADRSLRLVIDTNVWISAFLSRKGLPAYLIRVLPDQALPVFSLETFAELESRLWKPKFDRYLGMEERRNLLDSVDGMALWVEAPKEIKQRTYSRDRDDDKFIHAAFAAQSKWVVSGDDDLLCLDPVGTLRVVTPRMAFSEISWLTDGGPSV